MEARRGPGVCLAFAAILLLVAGARLGAQPPAAAQGASLFEGQTRFENGGPPCASCHRLSSLGFPNGGTVGPDLSPAYQALGSEGTDVTLKTLFFPTMMPLYERRPLTEAEQRALKALLQQASPTPQGESRTPVLAAIAIGGCLALLAVAWFAGRRRLGAVRAPLVRARAGATLQGP